MKIQGTKMYGWKLFIGLFSLTYLATSMIARADSGDVTDDIIPLFICGPDGANATCPGYTMAVWADVDGIDNGTTYDPYETMVTFHTVSGSGCGTITGGGEKLYHHSFTDTGCVPPGGTSCMVDGSCDRGRFVISFVDMTVVGFDQTNPATWVYKSVPSLRFFLENSLTSRPGVADPYHQAKAYKIDGDPLVEPDATHLIDGISTCNAPDGGGVVCEFSDPDDGIMEIWIRTDFVDSAIDGFVIHSPDAPGVALLMDGSGSMSWGHDGDRTAPDNQKRITLAKSAAIEFMDQLLDHGEGEVEFGIARFPRHPYDSCNATTVTAMTPVNAASHGTATGTTISSLETGGATPMLAGLQQAVGMLGSNNPKAVVLLSDGYHNCPSTIEVGDAAYTDLISSLAGIRVFTIGFSRPGDLSAHFLDELAADTVGVELGVEGFYDVTAAPGFDPIDWNPATALDATYTKVLVAGLGLDTVVEPFASLSAGETNSHQLTINGQDHKLSFHVSWTTSQADRLSIRLKASDGSSVESENAGVRVHAGPTYRIITVDNAFLAQANRVSADPWLLEIEGSGIEAGASESYQYSVIADSAVKMRAWLDKKSPRTGDVITLTTRATEYSTFVKTLDQVEVRLTRPSDGLGNWFAENKLDQGALDKIPPNLSGEQLPRVQRKAMYLTEIGQVVTPGREAVVSLPMYDDGTHGDVTATDGLYTTQYSDTIKEGTYSFLFHMRGTSNDGMPFERQRFIQKHVSVAPSSDHLGIAVLALGETDDKIKRFAVTVTPRDALGNYFGPSRSAVLSLSASQGQFEGAIVDNLDGSYTQNITLPLNVDENTVDVVVDIEDSSRSFNLGEYTPESTFGNWLFLLILLIVVLLLLILRLRR